MPFTLNGLDVTNDRHFNHNLLKVVRSPRVTGKVSFKRMNHLQFDKKKQTNKTAKLNMLNFKCFVIIKHIIDVYINSDNFNYKHLSVVTTDFRLARVLNTQFDVFM